MSTRNSNYAYSTDTMFENFSSIANCGSEETKQQFAEIFFEGLEAVGNEFMSSGTLVKDTEAYKALETVGRFISHSPDFKIIPGFRDAQRIFELLNIATNFPKHDGERIDDYTTRIYSQLDKYKYRHPLVSSRRDEDNSLPDRRQALRRIGFAASAGCIGVTLVGMGSFLSNFYKDGIDLGDKKIGIKEFTWKSMKNTALVLTEFTASSFTLDCISNGVPNLELKDVETHPNYQRYIDNLFKQLPEIKDKLMRQIAPQIDAMKITLSPSQPAKKSWSR